MREALISILIVLLGASSQADEKVLIYKNWKTFRSNYGYEFKYPDCWSVGGDGPDEPAVASGPAKDIMTEESDACRRAKMDPEASNGIGISAGWHPLKSIEEGLKKMDSVEKHGDNNVVRDEWKIYKHLKIDGGGEALIHVENNHNVSYTWIRWKMEIYCPTQQISFTGPSIRNPDESYIKKFKAGDLALPEPEKTIYASIKCVEPKKQLIEGAKK